jgi:hypothetical protein
VSDLLVWAVDPDRAATEAELTLDRNAATSRGHDGRRGWRASTSRVGARTDTVSVQQGGITVLAGTN